MLRFLVEFGPAIAFYLIALAAQVSGYTNARVALGLAVIATTLLLFPLWDFSPLLAKWCALAGGAVLSLSLAWHYRSKLPWRLRLERTDQPKPGEPTGSAAPPDLGLMIQRGEWRISTGRPAIAEPLAKLIARADALIGHLVVDADALEIWKRTYQDWYDDAMRFLRTTMGNESRALVFAEIDEGVMSGSLFTYVFDEDHRRLLHRLRRQREQLRHWHAMYVD